MESARIEDQAALFGCRDTGRYCKGVPFEAADHSMDYGHWRADRLFLLVPAQQYVGQFLATFKEFPPSQKVGSFSLDQVLQTLQTAPKGGN